MSTIELIKQWGHDRGITINGTTLDECIEIAYNDIKDRKGFLNTDGVFIKGDV